MFETTTQTHTLFGVLKNKTFKETKSELNIETKSTHAPVLILIEIETSQNWSK